jgi:hypothetical protein
MEAIETRYPDHKKIFHTDATGTANKSSAAGVTDINIIEGYGIVLQVLQLDWNTYNATSFFLADNAVLWQLQCTLWVKRTMEILLKTRGIVVLCTR